MQKIEASNKKGMSYLLVNRTLETVIELKYKLIPTNAFYHLTRETPG